MNPAIWARKLNDKYRFKAAYFINGIDGKTMMVANGSKTTSDGLPDKDKYNKTNYHRKRNPKRCYCGTHSVNAHKERDKFPRWKRQRHTKYSNFEDD